MMMRPGMRDLGRFDFLFEFKYVKLKDVIIDKKPLSGEEASARNQDELLEIEKIKFEMDEAKKTKGLSSEITTQVWYSSQAMLFCSCWHGVGSHSLWRSCIICYKNINLTILMADFFGEWSAIHFLY